MIKCGLKTSQNIINNQEPQNCGEYNQAYFVEIK